MRTLFDREELVIYRTRYNCSVNYVSTLYTILINQWSICPKNLSSFRKTWRVQNINLRVSTVCVSTVTAAVVSIQVRIKRDKSGPCNIVYQKKISLFILLSFITNWLYCKLVCMKFIKAYTTCYTSYWFGARCRTTIIRAAFRFQRTVVIVATLFETLPEKICVSWNQGTLSFFIPLVIVWYNYGIGICTVPYWLLVK